jgi:hypothetical protein
MITAIVIPVDLREPIGLEQFDPHDLNAYRRLVVGNLQVLNLDRPPASLYINEEGRQMGMPVNTRATALLWVHHSAFRDQDVLVGPAFIVGTPDKDGDDTSAPQDLIDLLLHTTHYRLHAQFHGVREWEPSGEVFTDWFSAYVEGIRLTRRWTAIAEVRVVPELDDKILHTWYRLGRDIPEIAAAEDPPFTKDSFTGCYSVEELAERIDSTTWVAGAAFYYRDLCVINQVDGGDEWLTIRHGIAFESLSLAASVEDGAFASLVHRLLAASKEQLQRLEY